MIITHLITTLAMSGAIVNQGQDKVLDNAERMLNTATATQPLVVSAIVDAPVKDIWKAYTTEAGIKSWMVAEGTIDLKVGGLMRTSYKKGSDLTGPDVIENKILSFDPEHMFAMQTVRTPQNFPYKKAIFDVWTVLYFESMGPKKTNVICRTLGFDGTQESTNLRLFFMRGNKIELDELVKHFKK
ncbi:MAG: SRPBCC domain-containing protein [Armatimonadota bacterium]